MGRKTRKNVAIMVKVIRVARDAVMRWTDFDAAAAAGASLVSLLGARLLIATLTSRPSFPRNPSKWLVEPSGV